MSLMLRDPYDPFRNMDRTMNQILNRMQALFNDASIPFDHDVLQARDANMLAVDMSSDEKHIIVRTALPGFTEDEVNVDVRGNVLTISAESKTEREDQQANWHIRELRYGKFARSVVLPEEVFVEHADASLTNGILTVKLPKQKPGPIRKIVVKARNLLKAGNKKDK